ncbi:MAG: hypothetical protein ACHQZR_05635 [Candidatus Limnocylindrales bacterium]
MMRYVRALVAHPLPGLMAAGVLLLAACSSGPSAAGNPSAAAGGSSTVTVGTSASLGPYLVSPNGMTLYVFDKDPVGTTTSACAASDGCDVTWPAFVPGSGGPSAGSGVSGTLTTITGEDGKPQVTYNGRPLYNYSGDTGAGQTNGDGVDGTWHIAKP